MSYAWDEMTDKEHAAALELMGGKRNANAVQAVIQQFQIAEESLATAQNSAGSAMKENEKYMNSIQGKLTKFQATFEVLSNDLLNSELVKGVVDLGTGALDAVDGFIKLAGAIPAVTTALTALVSMSNIDTSGSVLNLLNIFGTTKQNGQVKFSILGKEADQLKADIQEIMNVMESASKYFGESSSNLKLGAFGSILLGNGKKDYDIAGNLKTDVDALTSLFDRISNKTEDFEKAMESVKQSFAVSKEFDEFTKNISLTGKSFDQLSGEYIPKYITNVTGATAATTIFSGAIETLKAVGGTLLASFAIGIAVSAVTKAIGAISSAIDEAVVTIEEAKDKSKEMGNSLNEEVSSLDSYITKISELKTSLDEGNLSYSEAYDARKELLGIQNELYEKYGEEVSGLNLVNGTLEDQIELLDQVIEAKYRLYLNDPDNKRAINNAQEQLITKYPYSTVGSLDNGTKEEAQRLQEIASNNGLSLTGFSGDYTGTETFTISIEADAGNAEKAYSDFLADIENDNTLSEDSKNKVNDIVSNVVEGATTIINENSEIAETAAKAQIALNDTWSTLYGDLETANEKYVDAVSSGNEEAINDALKSYNAAKEAVKNTPFDEDTTSQYIKNYMQSYIDQLDAVTKEQSARSSLKDMLDTYPEAYEECQKALDNLTDSEKKYGNVSNTNRDIIHWSKEEMEKYKEAIDSWGWNKNGDLEGTYSTAQGSRLSTSDFGTSNDLTVAFTPLLQTDSGLVPLTTEEFDNYMSSIINNAKDSSTGEIDAEKLLALDSAGIEQEVNGQIMKVSGLIAGVEGQIVDGVKLTAADIAAIAGETTGEIKGQAIESSNYVGRSMHDIQSMILGYKDVEIDPLIHADFDALLDYYDVSEQKAEEITQKMVDGLKGLDGLDDVDILNIGSLEKAGNAATSYTQKQIDAYNNLVDVSDFYGISVEDLIGILTDLKFVYSETSNTIDDFTDSSITSASNVSKTIGLVTEALNSQSTSAGVSKEAYDALIEADGDYAAALEFSNGYMKINREMAEKITDAKTQEAKANIELAYSQNQMKYSKIKADMATLDKELQTNTDLTEEQKNKIEEAKNALEEQSAAIRENCNSLKLQYSSLVQASSAYQDWLNAQNASEAGDMYNGTFDAKDAITEGLTTGKIGTVKYKAAIDLLVPEDAQDDVAEYMKTINRYMQEDSDGNVLADGLNNFIKDSITAGLMSANDDGSITMAAEKTIQDYADAMHLTPDMVQAIFGALQDYGWEINWEDQLGNEIDNLRMKIDDIHDKMEDLGPGAEGTDQWNALNEEAQKYQEQLDKIYSEQGSQDPVQVAIDLSNAQASLEELTTELSGKSELSVVDIQNLTEAQERVEVLQQQKEKLGDPTAVQIEAYIDSDSEAETQKKIQELVDAGVVKLDTTNAKSGIDSVLNTVDTIVDTASNVTLVVNTSQAQSNVNKVSEALNSLPTKKDFVLNVSVNTTNIPQRSTLFGGAKTVTKNIFDSMPSIRKASAYGGKSSGGKTLVGELGNEIVVNPRTGKWYTVGDHGAEFVNLPKDAIVFDHEKTQKLLGQGFVGARGDAYAGGTAMASGLPNYAVSGGGGYIIGQNPATAKTYNKNTKAVNDNTKALNDNKDAIEEQKKALESQKEALEKQKEAYEKESNALKIYGQAAINEIDKRIDAINEEKEAQQKSFQNQIEQLQKYQEEQNKVYENQIKDLEEKKKALQKTNDEEDRALKLAELQDELARAQSQRTVRIYDRDEGFVWRVDQESVDEAQDNIDDQQREWKNEDALDAIDEEIDKINELQETLDESIESQIEDIEERQEAMEESFDAEIERLEEVKEQWSDALNLIGMSWEDYQTQLSAAAEFNGMSLESMAEGVGAYKDDVIANMQAIGQTSAEIDKVTNAITALENVASGGSGEEGSSGGGGGGGSVGGIGGVEGELGEVSGGISGLGSLSAQLQEAGGVSAETAEKLEELRNKIIETGEANVALGESEAVLTEMQNNTSLSLSERTEASRQLGQVQTQIAENQGILTDLSAQYVETLGNETTATDEARQIATDSLAELTEKYGVSYEEIFAQLDEYVTKLAETGTGTTEQFTSMQTTIQTFSTSITGSLTAAGAQFSALSAQAQAMASSVKASCESAINSINALKSAQSSAASGGSNPVKAYASGILNSPTTHVALTDEAGPEIKIRPMRGQYSLIEKGTSVIPADPSENLWKFGLNPDSFIEQHIRRRSMPVMNIEQRPETISIGDVSIEMHEVNDVESFGQVLAQKAPSIIAQTFSRRK